MGFPHCPICVALALFTFCVVVTRSYLLFLLFYESLNSKDEKDYSSLKYKHLLSL